MYTSSNVICCSWKHYTLKKGKKKKYKVTLCTSTVFSNVRRIQLFEKFWPLVPCLEVRIWMLVCESGSLLLKSRIPAPSSPQVYPSFITDTKIKAVPRFLISVWYPWSRLAAKCSVYQGRCLYLKKKSYTVFCHDSKFRPHGKEAGKAGISSYRIVVCDDFRLAACLSEISLLATYSQICLVQANQQAYNKIKHS